MNVGQVPFEGFFVNGPDPDDTGVIFRINPEDGSPAPNNPFINSNNNNNNNNNNGNNNDELSSLNKYYAYGIRNSFGIAFDPVTNILWDTENGPTDMMR